MARRPGASPRCRIGRGCASASALFEGGGVCVMIYICVRACVRIYTNIRIDRVNPMYDDIYMCACV